MTAPSSLPGARARWQAIRPQFFKAVRRLHLYTGLLLMPWVLLFGMSALVFNHPALRGDAERELIDADRIEALTGFAGLEAQAGAEAVVASLREKPEFAQLKLDPNYSPRFEGWALFEAKAGGEMHRFNLDLESGAGEHLLSRKSELGPRASFAGELVEAQGYRVKDLQKQLKPLSAELGLPEGSEFKGHRRASPDLLFRVTDEDGRAWNVAYDMRSRVVSARATGADSGYGFARIITRLHTVHGYPVHESAKTLWVFLADLMALTLIFWGLSGLIMWVQLKKQRKIGLRLLAGAALLGILAFGWTVSELTFRGTSAARGEAD